MSTVRLINPKQHFSNLRNAVLFYGELYYQVQQIEEKKEFI